MEGRLIRSMNPWWWGGEDHHLSVLSEARYRITPRWIERVSLEPFSLNFVLGPRQVGKTTGIKLIISRLTEEVDPSAVLYLDCEIFPDFSSLRRALEEFVDSVEGEFYVFLDEASSLPGWWRAVKPMVDAGLFRRGVVTVTGSSSLRVRRDAELFPGRMGRGRMVEVLPLGFPEFYELIGGGDPIEAFDLYLRVGGFPASVNGLPAAELLRALVGEIVRMGRSLEVSREVLAAVVETAPSPVSYRTLASRTSGYSYKVVRDYVEFFRALFLLEVAPLRRGGRVLHRAERKVFFRDPLLARIAAEWSGARLLESALYEWVVQEHLLRAFGEVYYWRDGAEVDCVAGPLRVEVKAGKPHRRYPRGVLVLEREDVPRFLLRLAGGGTGAEAGRGP